MLQLERMVIMNNLFVFLPFNFFSEDNTYPYLLSFALLFDFFIYDTYFLNTIFFTILYFLNRLIKTRHHLISYLFRNFINLTVGLIFYSIINNHFLTVQALLLSYLANLICGIILFLLHRKSIVIN